MSAQPRKSASGQDGGRLRRQEKAADHPEQHRSPKHPSFVSRPGDGRQQSREGNLSPGPEVHSTRECGRDHEDLWKTRHQPCVEELADCRPNHHGECSRDSSTHHPLLSSSTAPGGRLAKEAYREFVQECFAEMR